MKRLLIFLLFSAAATAQTIAPVVQECGPKCSGTFTLTNNTIAPMAVVIEPKSFDIINGKQIFKPLIADVQLSETSLRLGPKATHEFDFRVKCYATPCRVQFSVKMALGRTLEGLQVVGILPELIYVCDQRKDCRKNTLEAGGIPQR